MLKTAQHSKMMVVELAEGVKLHTAIAIVNQAALRSGFAGYHVNPRWGAAKYRAWKTGRQLRESLNQGELVVRLSDSMLVPINSCDRTIKARLFQRNKIKSETSKLMLV